MKKQLLFKEPIIDETHYILGSIGGLPTTAIVLDGNWKNYLPEPELQQKRGIETYDCTGFNTLNAIEILIYAKYGEKINYSDRWVGIIAGTSAKNGGNDPHAVAEAIRKYGLIPEEMLPFSDDLNSVDEYYSFKGMTQTQIDACYEEGRKWLKKYKFGHDWVFRMSQPIDEKINNMKVALKTSPLCIAVFAWQQDGRGVYVEAGQPNHWTSAFAQEQFTNVFDSYDPFIKLVEQNYLYCKRYTITKIDDIQVELNLVEKALKWISEQISLLIKQKVGKPIEVKPQEVYNEVKQELMETKLNAFCLAIRDYEGQPGDLNYRNNNPGNLKGVNGKFLKFKTYDEGFNALKDYVTRACTGKHKAYKPDMTINQFFEVYSPTSDSNNPYKYASYVCARVGLKEYDIISAILQP